jgi:DNA polymerase-3 subunit delta'
MAPLISTIHGHEAVLQHLQSAALAETMGPVQIFAGPSGVGKRRVALALTQLLLCEVRTGCGQCSSCQRVASGAHEALLLIENGDGAIKVEHSQKILEFLRLRSWSKNRAIIIDDAALMTLPAANSLLKALEEPFSGTYFFLITSSPFAVLPTVRSRAQWVRFQPLPLEVLRRLSPSSEEWMLRAAEGRMDRLQALSESDQQSLRQKAYTVLRHILDRNLPETRDALSSLVTSTEDGLLVVRLWIQLVRDAVVGPAGGTTIHQDLWTTAVDNRSRAEIHGLFQNLLRMEQDLLRHVDRNLVFDTFVFNACLLVGVLA